jgi:myo-inositol-1(or 4)-monophosphatase
MNGTTISCRDNSLLSDAMVCTGFSYRISERHTHAQRVAQMVMKVRDIRRFGAAAVDLCFVACGRLDAYFEEHLHSWDLVAGQIIATEAGAIVTNYEGASVTPEQVLATTPLIQKELIALIAEAGGNS